MTKEQKKALADAAALIEQASMMIEPIAHEAREKFEDLSEAAQQGARGEARNETATALEAVCSALENAASDCRDLA